MGDNPGISAERDAFNALGVLLYSLLAAGDERIVLGVSATSSTNEQHLRAYNPEGRFESPEGRFNDARGSFELSKAMKALRSAQYRPGAGTWFSARITVNADGSATAEYNYDEEPKWDVPVDPIAYVTDQDVFPRDEAHQPEWLKQKLAEGRVRLAARDK